MSFFDIISYFDFIPIFILILSIKSVVFLFVSKSKIEKKWNNRFYLCAEVSENSRIDPSFTWSYLTDPEKFMNFNYKRKIKWVKFEKPLKSGSEIRIRIRKGSILKGFLSFFESESKVIFEYHVWPNTRRFICEIEMIRLENENRYILRVKMKHLLAPLLKKIFPKIDEKMKNFGSEILQNCLAICEKNSETDQKKVDF